MAEESTDKTAAKEVKGSPSRGRSGLASITCSSIDVSTDPKGSSSQDRGVSPTGNTHQSPTRKPRSPGCYGGEEHLWSRNCGNSDETLNCEKDKMDAGNCNDDVDGTPGDLDHGADAAAGGTDDSSGDARSPRSDGADSSEEGPSPRDRSPSGLGRHATVYSADGAEPAGYDASDQAILHDGNCPSKDRGLQGSAVCVPSGRRLHGQTATQIHSRSRSQDQDRTLNSRNAHSDVDCDRNLGGSSSRSRSSSSSRSRSRSPNQRRIFKPVRREPDRADGGRMPQSWAGVAGGSGAGSAAAGGRQKVLAGPRNGLDLRGDVRRSPPPMAVAPREQPPNQWTYERRRKDPWDRSAECAPEPGGHGHGLRERPRPAIQHRGGSSALPYKDRRGSKGFEHPEPMDGPSGPRGGGPGHLAAPREQRPCSPSPVHGVRHQGNHRHHNHDRQEYKYQHQHQHERQFAEQQPSYGPGPGVGAGGSRCGRDSGDGFNDPRVGGAPHDPPASARGSFRGSGDFGPHPLQAPPLRRGPSPPPPPRQRSGAENQMWEHTRGHGPRADPSPSPGRGTGWGREPRSPGAVSYREKGPYVDGRGWDSGPAPGAGHQPLRGEDRRGAAMQGPSSGSDRGPRWAPPHLVARFPPGLGAPADRSGASSPHPGPRSEDRPHAHQSGPQGYALGRGFSGCGTGRGGGGDRSPESGRYRRGPPSPPLPPPPPPARRHSGGGGGAGPPNMGPDLHGSLWPSHASQEPRGGAAGGRHGGRATAPPLVTAGGGAWTLSGRRSPSPPPHRRHVGNDLPGGPSYESTGPFRRPVSPYRESGPRSPQPARWEAAHYATYDRRRGPANDPGFRGRSKSPPAPMYGTQGSDRLIVDDGRGRGPYSPPSPLQMRARPPLHESNDPRDGLAPWRHRGIQSPPRHLQDRGAIRQYPPSPPRADAAAAAPRFGDPGDSRNGYERSGPSAGGDGPNSFKLAPYGRGGPPSNRRFLSPPGAVPDAKRREAVDVSDRGERGLGFETSRGSRRPGSPRRTAPPNPGHHGHSGRASFRERAEGAEGNDRRGVSPDRVFGRGRQSGGMDPDPIWNHRNAEYGNDRPPHHARSPPLGRRGGRSDGAPPHAGGPATRGSQHPPDADRSPMYRSFDGGRMYHGADGGNRSAAAAAGGDDGSGHSARPRLRGTCVTAGDSQPSMGATNASIAAATTTPGTHDESAMVWFYKDPMGQNQGPCCIRQFRSWVRYLGQNAAFRDEYEKFRSCSVWRDPQDQPQRERDPDGVSAPGGREGASGERTTLSELLRGLE
ncbi:hypothetical protein VaNZ11_009549 [Volvox africanus]|uniref:GYF domain-containing protein n=1 Tax=Volvox africanus TaxID=51714 RepID=A0ABQ5S984_9CHLO|nr:hypothetical protein VaNZ11_009549 [Volvox africanus]